MTEVYKTDEIMNTLIRQFSMLQFRGSRKHITNYSKHRGWNTFTVMQLMDCKTGTEHNTISITNKPVITPEPKVKGSTAPIQ